MKNSLIITILVFVVGGGLYVASTQFRADGPHAAACSAEALMCPDGSYVGRSGPACAFAACPAEDTLEGVLEKQGEGYRLLMAAPDSTSSQEVSYSLPLVISSVASAEELLGAKVAVKGSFTDGNTLRVSTIEKLAGDAGDPTTIMLGVGASGFVNGVKITVLSITADSRCASDVQCIQAGSLTAEVTLQSDTDKETRVLVSGADPVGFDSYRVSLARVAPTPVSTKPIATEEYRLTFEVVVNQ